MRYWVGPWVFGAGFGDNHPWNGSWIWPDGCELVADLRPTSQQQVAGVALWASNTKPGPEYDLVCNGDPRTVQMTGPQRRNWNGRVPGGRQVAGTLRERLIETYTELADPAGLDRIKPLQPNTRGRIRIGLETGAGEILNRRFRLTDPGANRTVDLMQRTYREIRERARSGDFIGPRGADGEAHRRFLTAFQEKTGIDNPEDVFIPGDLPREERLPRETTHTESFNQADSSTLGPDLTWTEQSGSWDTVSNEVRHLGGADGFARADADVSGNDNYGQIDIVTLSSGKALGSTCRMSSSAIDGYGCYVFVGVLYLFSVSGGTRSAQGNSSCTESYPNPCYVEIDGNALECSFNGTTVTKDPITTHSSGTRGGIFAYWNTTVQGDNFEVADLGGAPSGPSPTLYMHTLMGVG